MKIFKLCKPYLIQYKWKLLTYIILSALVNGLLIYGQYLIGNFIDVLTSSKNIGKVLHFCIMFSTLSIIRLLIEYATTIIYIKIQTKMGFDLNRDILFHIQKISITFLSENNTAYLNQTINNDSNAVIIFCITFIQKVITNVITIVATLYICIKINVLITSTIFVFVLMYLLLYIFTRKNLYKVSMDFKERQGKFFANLQEQINYAQFLKIHSVYKEFRERLHVGFNDLFFSAIKKQRMSYLFASADTIVFLIAQITLFLLGSIQILNGKFSIGKLTVFSSYYGMIMSSARFFFTLGKTYQDNLVSYNRLMNIINQPEEEYGDYIVEDLQSLRVQELSYAYKGKLVLEKVTINFKKGKIYGIIGANGTGKSTLITLLAGMYQNEKGGEIYYNSFKDNFVNLDELRKSNIGIAEQNTLLINDTIRYNLLLGGEHSINEINKYISLLNLNDFISKQTDGIDTLINENNTNLSEGEKKIIAILRVLIKNPEVMIFDEPTSSLDRETIKNFLEYLLSIKNSKTILLVTHSKEVIDICDEVYELSGGYANKII